MTLKDCRAKLAAVRAELADARAAQILLQSQNAAQADTIASQAEQLARQSDEIVSQTAAIASQANTIADQQLKIAGLEQQISDLEARIAELEGETPTASVELGAWAEFGGDGNSSIAEQEQFDTLSGAKMAASMMYAPFSASGKAYAFAPSEAIYQAGRWVHWAWGNPPSGTDLARFIPDIAAGKYDALLTQTAKNAAAAAKDRRMQLRPFWEMNQQQEWNASHYGQQTALYVQAWQRLAGIFRTEAPGVELVWSPAWHSVPAEPWNAMSAYYPGDEYVDRIGVEPYCNFGVDTTVWRSWEQLAAETVSFADGRDLMMTEGGCLEDANIVGRKAVWIEQMRDYVKTLPNFRELLWFHRPAVSRENGKDYRVDTSSSSLAAWRALCADPYFGGAA